MGQLLAPPRLTLAGAARRDRLVGVLMLAPAVAGLGVFVLWPMLDALRISFYDRRLTTHAAPFVGLANWESIATDREFLSSMAFTALYTVGTVAVSVVLGLGLSLAFLDRPVLRRVVGPLILLPTATTLVVASVGWRFVFDLRGGLNRVLEGVGIARINWLNDPSTAQAVVILVGIWSMAGFTLLLYQAALSRVPAEVFEAAKVFGRWRGLRNKALLIVPLVSRTTIVAVVISTIVALRAFDLIVALTSGGPDGSTENLAYLGWQRAFRYYNLGQGAAASTVLIVFVLIVTAAELVALKRLVKGSYA